MVFKIAVMVLLVFIFITTGAIYNKVDSMEEHYRTVINGYIEILRRMNDNE